ncbi:uncharacterized protein K452DRAFT_229368 [Aplosporella prunicola CBS 121167]|uniref:3-beta hydroxysteroid dehydrogenase/isomerase domain-containing protein n=1 Tax=Aplosporella prunicola CBS 121167 TaxID=1176127 RepID=A0A6A6BET5_9PEZI|nr:uncharacterized protein K452DRAFT_229368 [Aplosporella prunicola CBS 121167]KAF2140991.1 hypothetical protein K452DRAFT_229368 [Aplosporella prunicola CBS 121167]
MASLSLIFLAAGVAMFLYLCHLNRALSSVPDEVTRLAAKPWTEDEVKATYGKIQESPLDFTKHLPARQGRRYIVVGGSGLVGGAIVLHLLARGEDPEAIRIIDLHNPTPQVSGGIERSQQLSQVSFEHADISNSESVHKAFSAPWPPSVSHLPLTVHHCAAVIRPVERTPELLHLCTTTNVTGTAHVLAAAKATGATCFIATSSASIAVRRAQFWLPPWRCFPHRFFQLFSDTSEHDYDLDRPHASFYSNYAASKAMAERLIRAADDKATGFRTGVIRPANGIYGSSADHTVGNYLLRRGGPSWIPHIVTNFVSAENVSLGHHCFEQRLLDLSSPAPTTSQLPDIGGRAFTVTDPNPPIRFADIYTAETVLSGTPTTFTLLPPLPFFLLAHALAAYAHIHLALQRLLSRLDRPARPALSGDIAVLQPALWDISGTHLVFDDAAARRTPAEGGLGYRAPFRTIEGVCAQIVEWNRECAVRSVEVVEEVVKREGVSVPVGA